MSGPIYLRFKRQKSSIFVTCEPDDELHEVKQRLAKLVKKDSEDIKLYRFVTIGQRKHEKELKDKETKKEPVDLEAPPIVEKEDDSYLFLQCPEFDEARAVCDLGLKNDEVVFFVYRLGSDSPEFEAVDVDFYWDEAEQKLNDKKRAIAKAAAEKAGAGKK